MRWLLIALILFPLHASAEESGSAPFIMPWDAAPVDLSGLLDPPAGKHGFLGIDGERFIFEDGSPARFWGVTLTGSGCFPDQALAPKIADRLAKSGVNLVRFHRMDADWADPPLLVYGNDGYASLNPVALDRLDFFLMQLKNRGIYACFDMLGSRSLHAAEQQFFPAAGVDVFEGYIHFMPELRRLHARVIEQFWTRRNRYPDREGRVVDYRDDPGIVFVHLFETIPKLERMRLSSTERAALEERWREWLIDSETAYQPLQIEQPDRLSRRFWSELIATSQAGFVFQLRSLGVKVPIAGSLNLSDSWDLNAQGEMDFIAAHAIWNRPFANYIGFPDEAMVDADPGLRSNLISELAWARIKDKPFAAMGWDSPWPNSTRAELPLWLAAASLLQDWPVCVANTYRSYHEPGGAMIDAPFESFNDPARFGLMPAAALLFHRAEIDPLRRDLTLSAKPESLSATTPVSADGIHTSRLADRYRIESTLRSAANGRSILWPTQPESIESARLKREPPREFRHDHERGLIAIDTSSTQALIGRMNQSRPEDLSGIRIDCDNDFGVICVSSLDEEEIERSRDLLLTAVSRANNSGFESQEVRQGKIINQRGTAPAVIDPVSARVEIKSDHEAWQAAAINAAGRELERLPIHYSNGMLIIDIGASPTIYFRLTPKPASE